jgi:hypothetical protein
VSLLVAVESSLVKYVLWLSSTCEILLVEFSRRSCMRWLSGLTSGREATERGDERHTRERRRQRGHSIVRERYAGDEIGSWGSYVPITGRLSRLKLAALSVSLRL